MKPVREPPCDMTHVNEALGSNTQMSGMFFDVANNDSCYLGIAHLETPLTRVRTKYPKNQCINRQRRSARAVT